jgi:uncharacterized delta-60 repeat protein
MQARILVYFGILACGLAMAEVVEPPAPVVKTNAVNAQAANTAPTFTHPVGKVISDFGSRERAFDGSIQLDGKVVLSGEIITANEPERFALARYLTNGSLDPEFGVGGLVITAFGERAVALSMAIQPDGKIVVVGFSGGKFALARYLTDGTLDPSFGVGGLVTTAFDASANASSVAIQSDGKILVAGHGLNDFILARYLSNGTLDPQFGMGGFISRTFGSYTSASSIAVQSDGKILVAGGWYTGIWRSFLSRYQLDGRIDAGFGDNGTVFYGKKFTHDLATHINGGIIAVAESDLFRFVHEGSANTSFGNNGVASLVGFNGERIATQLDGKFIVVGYGGTGISLNSGFAVARYLSDGTLDSSFGAGGLVITGLGKNSWGHSVNIRPNGRIVVVGESLESGANNYNIALAQFLPDGSLDTTFGPSENTLAFQPTVSEQSIVTLNPKVQILDTELTALGTYDSATLTIARQGGVNPEDVFTASGSMSTLTPGSYFAVNGVNIGQVLANSGGTLQLRFLGANANQARVDKAMQQIAYTNASDRPPIQVLIDWTFEDGNTGAQGIGGPLSTTGTVTVNITPVNDGPQLVNPLSLQIATVGQSFNFTVPVDTFNDPDGDTLSYSLTMADNTDVPPWLSFNSATRTLSGMPSVSDVGMLNLMPESVRTCC